MIRATLSILGIYNVRPDIFDKFHLPAGVDRDVLEPELLAEVAELESLYTDPDILKDLIGAWSSRRMYAWTKLLATTKFEYNPIWNVDANETETETNERDISRLHTGSNNETRNLTDAETVNLTDTESVQGFNSNEWSESKRNVKSGTDTVGHTGTDNIAITNNETVDDDNERVLTKRRTGNIGVTASQDLIKKEREIADFSIIEYITQSFKERFCLLVY